MQRFRGFKGFLFLMVFLPVLVMGEVCTTYDDIDGSQYKSEILDASDLGWIVCRDKFNPSNPISRIEALGLALKVGGHNLSETTEQCFDDVPTDSWQNKYVCYAKSNGMIADNATFRPNDPASFQEASKMILLSMTNESYNEVNDPDNWGDAYLEKMSYYGFTDDKSSNINRDYFVHIITAIHKDPNKQATVSDPKVISSSISPSTVTIGDSISVNATLDKGLSSEYKLKLGYESSNGVEKLDMSCSSTSCSRSFTTDKLGDGQKLYLFLEKNGDHIGELVQKLYNVKDVVVPSTVTSVSPTTASLNEETTFTVTGTNLPDTLTMYIPDCQDMTALGGSDSSRAFSCTPIAPIGSKASEVKDKAGGDVLKTFTVEVSTIGVASIVDVSVNPLKGVQGSDFEFKATLSEALSSQHSIKVQLESEESDRYLDTLHPLECTDLNCSFTTSISVAKYHRKARFATFDSIERISDWKIATYDVAADPALNEAPIFKEAFVSREGNNLIPLGQNFKFYTQWSDKEKDFVVDVRIRYRKVGSSSWSDEIVLDYYQNTTFVNNKKDIKIASVGTYEFQTKASDVVALNTTAIHTTDWKDAGSFEVTDSIKPILITDKVGQYLDSAGLVSFNLTVIDDNNDIDRIDVDWSGIGATVEAFRNLQSGDSIAVSHKRSTSTTITATAYDKAGNASNMVKVVVTVKPPYVPKTYYPNSKTNVDGSTDIECGSANSVGFASGAEKFNLSFLNQKGLIPLSFNLSYNSLLLTRTEIGRGWSTNDSFTAHIQEKIDGDVLVYWNDKNYNLFEKDHTNASLFASKDKLTQYDNLVQNSDKSYTLTRKNRVVYHFDKYGTLESIENHKGNKLGFIFDENSSLSRVTDTASGLFIEYHYENSKLVKVTDSIEREVTLTYSDDNASNLIKIEAPENISYTFEYNEIGQITKYSYGDGTTHFKNTYLDNGLVESEDDGIDTNQVMTFTFDHESDPNKIFTTFSDRNGDISKYEYDSQSCNMLSMIDKLNNKTINTFDDKHQLTSSTNAKNQTTKLEYNANGDVIKKISPDGSYEELVYDEHKNLISHSLVSSDGSEKFTTSYEYDTNNNLIKKTAPNGESSTFTYNEENLLLTQTSPKGNSVSYAYDTYKRVATITYPNGKSVSYIYDTIGRVIKQIDQSGNEVRFIYDDADRVVEIINALGNSATFTYDQRGNRLTATDPMGNSSSYTYDANNNLLTQTNALGAVTTFAYDGEDRVIKVTDANGNAVSFEYDAMGRVVKSIDAMGNSSSVEYDALGNVKKSYDAMGNMVAELFYDNTNKLVKAVDNLNQSTQTSYNLLGQPSTITDAKERVSKFNYDKAGRLIEAIDTMSGKSTQSFDKDGNRIDFSDPKESKTTYTYNNLGLPTSITTATGSTTTFAYDDSSRLSESINARGQSSTISYNADGSIKSIKDEVGVIEYSYDKNGNVLTISEKGKTISMSYSAINQLLSYSDGEGNTIAYTYDKVGNLVTLTYPNGKAINYSYNANNQLILVTDNSKTTAYEYDKNSRVVKITRPNGTILTREYNNASQLVSQKDVTPSGAVISEFSFKYDKVGNIIEETNSNEISPKALANIEMSYLKGNILDEANSSKAIFDADDNMLEFANLKLGYDSRNRLVDANGVTYSYNVLNNKIAKTSNGETTKYIINPNAPLSQLLEMRDAQNISTTYTYGLGLVSQTKADKTLYYHYDLRGSTIALTDESGEIVDRFSYLPYGELYKHSLGTTDTPFLYNGRDGVMREENNLYYMRARFYSTDVKRFVNRDVLIGGIADFGSLNRFGYVSGNSVSFIDPLGLKEWEWWKNTKNYLSEKKEQITDGVKKVKSVATTLQYTATTKAIYYAKKGFHKGKIAFNKSKNLRGMIKKGGSLFASKAINNSKIAKNFKNVALGISLGIESVDIGKNMGCNFASNDNNLDKAGKFSSEVASLLPRTIGTIVFDIGDLGTQGLSFVNKNTFNDSTFNSWMNSSSNFLKNGREDVKNAFEGENIYKKINNFVN